MMTNDIIGIMGVFALALVLFVIRYFILNLGRGKNKRPITATIPRASVESTKSAEEDDTWLLWAADAEQANSSTAARDELAERRRRAKRKASSSPR